MRVKAAIPVCSFTFLLTVERLMNGLIYLVGLVVVIMAILSFFGMH